MYLTQIGTKTKKPALYLLGKPRTKHEICVKYILPRKNGSMYLTQIGTKTKKPALYLLGKPRTKHEICVKYILPRKKTEVCS